MLKLVVLVSGGGSNLQAIIDRIEEKTLDAEITMVISDKAEAYALERARRFGIMPVCVNRKGFVHKEDFDAEILNQIDASGAELVVLAGYLSILSEDIVKMFPNRIINIHPAIIPSFCGKGFYGGKVHQAAIDYGVKLSGATVHFVDEGTDTGPIILQEAVPVYHTDDAAALAARVLEVEHRLLPKAIGLISDNKIIVEGRKVIIKD